MDESIEDRYVVGRALGETFQGRAFEVWDRVDKIPRVLKLLPEGSIADFRAGFERFAALDHPNLARLHSLGRTGSRCFVIEEQLHAVPFDAIAWSSSEPGLLLDAVYQCLVALEFLHGRGLIHGNLKPQNLLCAAPRHFEGGSPEERYRELRLHGTVRLYLADPHMLDRSQLQMTGSAAYMAPEVFQNEADPRSDLYSLAVVLFEALAGHLPFPDVRELLRPSAELPPFPYPPSSEPLGRFLRRLGHTRRDERLPSAAEAIALLEQGVHLQAGAPRVQSFRLVDRSTERGALGQAIALLKEGHGSVLVIEGPDGIGKTRLMEEVRSLAQSSGIATTQRPISEEAGSASQLLGGAGSSVPSLAGKTGLALASLVVRRLIAEVTAPLVLFCPDLHHASPSIDEALDLLSRSVENVPLLLVGSSCRPIEIAPACRIGISGLHGAQFSQFVADATGAIAPRPGFVEKLESLTGGNPLFALLAIDLLRGSGAVTRKGGRWSFELQDLPQSAYASIEVERPEDLIQLRLDCLQPEEARTLAAFHVLRSEPLRRSDIETLLGSASPVPACCGERLLRSSGARAPTICRLLSAAAYARLPERLRAQLHERAYSLLNDRETRPALLCAHLLRTTAPRRAVSLLLEASDQAYQEGALTACIESLDLAAAHLELGPERSNILERLADRLLEMGSVERAGQCLREALLHPTAGRTLKLARTLLLRDQAADARGLLETLRYDQSLEEVDRLHLLGQVLLEQDLPDDADRMFVLAEALARRHGDRVRLGRVLLELGNSLLRSGSVELALERFQEALGIFRAEGVSKMQAVCLNAIGLCSFQLRRWDAARASLAASIELQESLGALDKVLSSRTNLGQLCAQIGRWDEAERQYKAAFELCRRIAGPAARSVRCLGGLALLLMRRDNTEEALSLLEKAGQIAADATLPLEQATVLGWIGELHLLERRDHDAEHCLRRSIEAAADLDAHELRAENLRRLSELLFEQGWISDALACCREAQAIFADADNALESAQCDRVLGKIYVQQGNFRGALDSLESAITVLRKLEARYELGLTLLSRGLALSKSGFEQKAIETLEESIAIFRELGAPRDLHHAESLLRSLGAAHELIEVRHLKLLLSVVSRLNRSLDLKQVLGQILDCVLELTGAGRGLLMLENENAELELQVCRNKHHEELNPDLLDISQSIVRRVRTHRRSIVITDINDNALLRQRESIVRLGLRSVMCVPLLVESRMLGLIYVDDQSTSDNFYTRTDLGLLEAFAAQAAIAIDKAKLHAQLKDSYAELQASKANLEGAYKRLQGIQLSLSQAEKMSVLGHLASGIAHELNQPLTYLTSLVELDLAKVEDQDPSPSLASDFRKMLSTIEQMTDIVKGIHRYSKKTNTTTARIALRDPLEDALRILEHQLQMDGVHVIKLLEPGIEVVANRNQLTQVFINLLVNARDAMSSQADRRLTIETTSDRDAAHVRISDTGCGIDPSHMERLFEPFFTTKSEQRGTGLGLSVVKDIVEQHGGTLQLQSQPGAGTHAILRLPLRK